MHKYNMKRILSILALVLVSIGAFAQITISYGQISCYCPQTGQTLGGGRATAITFYDDYIYHSMYGKLYAASQNNDGSITYLPSGFAGTPGMQLNAVLISADRYRMEERMTSSLGYASINMINTFTSMGEDGGRAAQRWADANAASQRGGSRYDTGDDDDDDGCSSCGDTGVNPSPSSGGSRTSWVAHYNSQGNKCPYCGRYTQHYHDRCAHCNVPRY